MTTWMVSCKSTQTCLPWGSTPWHTDTVHGLTDEAAMADATELLLALGSNSNTAFNTVAPSRGRKNQDRPHDGLGPSGERSSSGGMQTSSHGRMRKVHNFARMVHNQHSGAAAPSDCQDDGWFCSFVFVREGGSRGGQRTHALRLDTNAHREDEIF